MPAILLICVALTVHDGDTLRASCDDGAGSRSIRIAEIDAPELAQPHGTTARDLLATAVHGHKLEITIIGRDRYGRTLANVATDGRDIGDMLVSSGAAWCYRGRGEQCLTVEAAAREKKVGLWADEEPMTPWDWRASIKRPQ